jgi:hypothetical protein
VNSGAVLEKVSRLPIHEWNYIGYRQRHIGPTAQDFHAQFPLNESDTLLNSADLDGVALAAIQGLNQKLEAAVKEKDARIADLERRNQTLEARLAVLERAFESATMKPSPAITVNAALNPL